MPEPLDLTSSLHPDDSIHMSLYREGVLSSPRKEFIAVEISATPDDSPIFLTREEARALFNWLGAVLTLDGQ